MVQIIAGLPLDAGSGGIHIDQKMHTYGKNVYMEGMRTEVPAGTTTPHVFDFKFTNTDASPDQDFEVELFNGQIRALNARDGDVLHVQMVDVDNVLTFGAGLVLADFLKNLYLEGTSDHYEKWHFTPPDRSKKVPAGIYIRVTFVPNGDSPANPNPVIIKGLLEGFK
jgi:hypothetical protein